MINLDLLDWVEQELICILQTLDGCAHHIAQGLWVIDLAQPLGDAGLPSPRALDIHVVDLAAIFSSLETNRTEIVVKILSAEASVPLQKIHGERMDKSDWQRITDRSVAFSGKPLFIDDSPNLTMVGIRAKARRLKQHNSLRLICIGYIQLITSGKEVESRQLEVSELSRQIKLLARELEVPVIALSQPSHNAEQRKDGVSQLADLRGSGSLGQDADIVIMLCRPEFYTRNPTDEERGQAALHILKRHNGQLNEIDAPFRGHYSRSMNQPVATFNPT